MLLDFKQLYKNHNHQSRIRGVVHIGANIGEERQTYIDHSIEKVAWFEADPSTYEVLKTNVSSLRGHTAYNLLLADVDNKEVEFQVTSNKYGASSSMLELDKHLIHHPHVTVIGKKKLKTSRFDTFVNGSELDMNDFNFLNIDVQGAELLVFKGAGDLMKYFDYVMTEINVAHLYKNCALLPQLDAFFENIGMFRLDTTMTHREWGDALYVKKTVIGLV